MKTQIKNLSTHQNGKVIAFLSALVVLPFILLMAVLVAILPPQLDQHGNPVHFPYLMFVIMPVLYLIFGYLVTVIACGIYNWLVQYTGGLEFEVAEENSDRNVV